MGPQLLAHIITVSLPETGEANSSKKMKWEWTDMDNIYFYIEDRLAF